MYVDNDVKYDYGRKYRREEDLISIDMRYHALEFLKSARLKKTLEILKKECIVVKWVIFRLSCWETKEYKIDLIMEPEDFEKARLEIYFLQEINQEQVRRLHKLFLDPSLEGYDYITEDRINFTVDISKVAEEERENCGVKYTI